MKKRLILVFAAIAIALLALAGCGPQPKRLLSAGETAEVIVNPHTDSAKKYTITYDGDQFGGSVSTCESVQNGECTWSEPKKIEGTSFCTAEYFKLDRCLNLPDGIRLTRDPTNSEQKEYGVVEYPQGAEISTHR